LGGLTIILKRVSDKQVLRVWTVISWLRVPVNTAMYVSVVEKQQPTFLD
jgi:hypothetical protein